MAKPLYITDLETDMRNLKANYQANREAQDKMFEIQGSTLKKLNDIHICLAGTDYDQTDGNGGKGGGVVRRLGRVEKKVTDIQVWRTKVVTKTNIIWLIVGGALTAAWSVIIANWSNIFN